MKKGYPSVNVNDHWDSPFFCLRLKYQYPRRIFQMFNHSTLRLIGLSGKDQLEDSQMIAVRILNPVRILTQYLQCQLEQTVPITSIRSRIRQRSRSTTVTIRSSSRIGSKCLRRSRSTKCCGLCSIWTGSRQFNCRQRNGWPSTAGQPFLCLLAYSA